MNGSTNRSNDAGRAEIPALEWLLGSVGALMVAGAIGFLAWTGAVNGDSPPDIKVEVVRVVEQRNGWLVQVSAFNEGGSAASEVTVGGEFTAPDGTVESAEFLLDYLPSRSDRQGGLLFSHDPRAGGLKVRALGYAEP
ncbi:uncharacterized protein (TIGR02588 family) [Skermanella aerolata]|uniref:TIGR02588 family protein n=1 Tax=Skermanella aerolata TaxID=393310 RepID=A0A512DWN3_9PROT|nr:hypothetical protein [Skermanella aerolata]KJB93773.1 hypothetical protein N826_14045 [Skermanella aerolata KACC 11604]GEO40872.1 hypothetical protein SAE02_50200 [Skermanella aerolata]